MFGRRKNPRPAPSAPAFPLDEQLFRELIKITHTSLIHARALCRDGRTRTAVRFLDELEWLVISIGHAQEDRMIDNATRWLSGYGRSHDDDLGQVHLLKLFGHLTEHKFFRPTPTSEPTR